jgi:hypothetical protein
LTGLRRKDRQAYLGLGARFFEHWSKLSPVFDRLAAGYLNERSRSWRFLGSDDDAHTLCALVAETFAWWAADERQNIASVREAAREVRQLQEVIRQAVDDICRAVDRCEKLCARHGLEIDQPLWVDSLEESLAEVSRLFPRWGASSEVGALIEMDRRALHSERPGVLDLVRAAHTLGAWSPELQQVRATDPRAAEALRLGSGSSVQSQSAQLRQLFVSLDEMAKRTGVDEGARGPLDWLTVADVSLLCAVTAGDDTPTRERPWCGPAHGFDPEIVGKVRSKWRNLMDRSA